ncbi:Alr0786 protein [Candidatus Paraburkholderia kirkii UZHbot1]|uniref:Alr0786 protein n=1 Tax=Candidatus Paraburkholderia kirkii UZHbot1 TaxID=1055526 RepID=G4M3V5_9BURK|nr:Alr0786 protein [Candidatus Paraburkholderia kirkii UZHbot1]
MHVHEKTFSASCPLASVSLDDLRELTREQLEPDETPVRFIVTRSDERGFDCEIGVLSNGEIPDAIRADGLFKCERRTRGGSEFNVVLIVPTGVGAEIGGHDGDAGPVAMLLSSICDRLITHPNVVNAADINELPANGLYVEGSVICRLLLGQIGLEPMRANRVLAVVGSNECPTFVNAAINSVNAARAAYGLDCPHVLHLDPGIRLTSTYASSGRAAGVVENLDALMALLAEHRGTFDAVAIASHIHVPDECRTGYYEGTLGMVNPWGGVEAMLTHTISTLFSVPSAHSPMYEDARFAVRDYGVVDPRIAPEVISLTFLQCILKGLKRAPRIVELAHESGAAATVSVSDVSCLVIPEGCIGLPVFAALAQRIPVIAVRENRNVMRNDLRSLPWAPGQLCVVDNYWEAAGVIAAMRVGLNPNSVRRPLKPVDVLRVSTSPARCATPITATAHMA